MGDGIEFKGGERMTFSVTSEPKGRRIHIRYARPHALYLRGPVTGQPYVFNPGVGTPVEVGDAEALIETGLFDAA